MIEDAKGEIRAALADAELHLAEAQRCLAEATNEG